MLSILVPALVPALLMVFDAVVDGLSFCGTSAAAVAATRLRSFAERFLIRALSPSVS